MILTPSRKRMQRPVTQRRRVSFVGEQQPVSPVIQRGKFVPVQQRLQKAGEVIHREAGTPVVPKRMITFREREEMAKAQPMPPQPGHGGPSKPPMSPQSQPGQPGQGQHGSPPQPGQHGSQPGSQPGQGGMGGHAPPPPPKPPMGSPAHQSPPQPPPQPSVAPMPGLPSSTGIPGAPGNPMQPNPAGMGHPGMGAPPPTFAGVQSGQHIAPMMQPVPQPQPFSPPPNSVPFGQAPPPQTPPLQGGMQPKTTPMGMQPPPIRPVSPAGAMGQRPNPQLPGAMVAQKSAFQVGQAAGSAMNDPSGGGAVSQVGHAVGQGVQTAGHVATGVVGGNNQTQKGLEVQTPMSFSLQGEAPDDATCSGAEVAKSTPPAFNEMNVWMRKNKLRTEFPALVAKAYGKAIACGTSLGDDGLYDKMSIFFDTPYEAKALELIASQYAMDAKQKELPLRDWSSPVSVDTAKKEREKLYEQERQLESDWFELQAECLRWKAAEIRKVDKAQKSVRVLEAERVNAELEMGQIALRKASGQSVQKAWIWENLGDRLQPFVGSSYYAQALELLSKEQSLEAKHAKLPEGEFLHGVNIDPHAQKKRKLRDEIRQCRADMLSLQEQLLRNKAKELRNADKTQKSMFWSDGVLREDVEAPRGFRQTEQPAMDPSQFYQPNSSLAPVWGEMSQFQSRLKKAMDNSTGFGGEVQGWLNRLGKLSKGTQPPPGFSPIPGSSKGGYRKHQGSGYVYWYPGQGGAGGGGSDVENASGEHHQQAQEHLGRMGKALETDPLGNGSEFRQAWAGMQSHLQNNKDKFTTDELKGYADKISSLSEKVNNAAQQAQQQNAPAKGLLQKLLDFVKGLIGMGGNTDFQRQSGFEIPDREVARKNPNFDNKGRGAHGEVYVDKSSGMLYKYGYIPHDEIQAMRVASSLGIGPAVYASQGVEAQNVSGGATTSNLFEEQGKVGMQFLNGYGTLKDWGSTIPSHVTDAHTLSAVKKLHMAGLSHNDLHPGNIMMSASKNDDGSVGVKDTKVIDYGKAMHSPQSALMEVADPISWHGGRVKEILNELGEGNFINQLQSRFVQEAQKEKSPEQYQQDIGNFYQALGGKLMEHGINLDNPSASKGPQRQ